MPFSKGQRSWKVEFKKSELSNSDCRSGFLAKKYERKCENPVKFCAEVSKSKFTLPSFCDFRAEYDCAH